MIRFSELKNMEIINLLNNEKLGYICDVEICISTGEISAILVPDKKRYFYNSGKHAFRIPWSKISGIGRDIILVNINTDE